MTFNIGLLWTVVMKFCIYIDIDKMYPNRLSNVIGIGRGVAEVQILNQRPIGPVSLT